MTNAYGRTIADAYLFRSLTTVEVGTDIRALFGSERTGHYLFADDSALHVLNGERFTGDKSTYARIFEADHVH